MFALTKQTQGLLFGFSTYILWGFLSLYWKLLAGVSAYDTFSWRIVFTVLTMLLYVFVTKQNKRFKRELTGIWQDKKRLLGMTLAGLLIASNWLVYIYAVGHGQATQASLGYYINPILSIFLSLLFLRERLSLWMWLALGTAATGVLVLIGNTGQLPLVSLALALTFSFYGLLKKQLGVSSDVAMLFEALVLLPFVVIYLVFFSQTSFLSYSMIEMSLLALSGLVTAVPLLCFSEAVKRAPLNLIGFIQYINPTIQLLLAVTLMGETIRPGEWPGFILIWLAIGIFILGQVLALKSQSSN